MAVVCLLLRAGICTQVTGKYFTPHKYLEIFVTHQQALTLPDDLLYKITSLTLSFHGFTA